MPPATEAASDAARARRPAPVLPGSAAVGRGKALTAALYALVVLGIAGCLGALVMTAPPLAFVAAAGVVAAVIFIRFRKAGILAVFFLVPLGPLLWLSQDGTISAQKLLIVGLIAVWIAQLLLTRDKTPFLEFTLSRLNLWGMLFLVVFVVSLPWARDKETAVLLILRWLTHLALLYFLVFNVRSFAFLRRCLGAILCIAFIMAVIAIGEHFTNKSILEAAGRSGMGYDAQLIKGEESGELVSSKKKTIKEEGEVAWSRSMATFKGPNELGLFLVFASGISLYFILRRMPAIWRLAAAVVLILCILGVNYTGSRGALGGLAGLAAVFVMLIRFPMKWFLITAFAIALLVFLMTPSNLGDQWRGGLNWEEIRQDTRVQWFQMSVEMFKDYPVAGIGLGQFQPRYFDYRVKNLQKDDQPPHNIVFQIGAENGALGLLLLTFMVYAVIREAGQLRTRPRGADHVLLGNVLLATFAGMMMFAMTSNVLLDETYWTFLTLIAIVATLYGAPREEKAEERPEEEMVVVIMPRSGYRLPS